MSLVSAKRRSPSSEFASDNNKRVRRSNNGTPKIGTLPITYGEEVGSLSQAESPTHLFQEKNETSGELNEANMEPNTFALSSMELEEEEKNEAFILPEPTYDSDPTIESPNDPFSTTTNNTPKKQQDRRSRIKESELRAEKLAEEERERLLKRQMGDEDFNRELYNHFNSLQRVASEYKIGLKLPELVVVGMQSDGKSSFVEALLGFQFNHVDTNIGTRRPLMLQMHHDPNKEKPYCIFQSEGKVQEKPIPVHQLEQEIRRRTEEVCGKDGVSSVPICLNVHYKYCANLVIIDTPGFRKGNGDPLSEKIEKMVMNLLKPKERIIVCLEQSTVEWCNTQVRPLIQKVDPTLSRTVFVCTKFNNRNNQFRDSNEVNKYLSTDGQVKDEKSVFFISLPSGHDARELSEEEFKEKIMEVYLQDYKHLSKIGFDPKYAQQIGFFNLRRHLELILNDRYKAALEPAIQTIHNLIEKKELQIQQLASMLAEAKNADVEQQAYQLLSNFVSLISKCLNGTNMFSTQKNGQTLEEEREKAGIPWPNFNLDVKIRNSQYKLYGGSQLERLLAEFEVVAHSQEFPATTDDEVAVTIGLNSLHTLPDYDRGASELAQKKSKLVFQPLIDVLLQRSKTVVRHMISMVCQYLYQDVYKKKFKKLLQELRNASDQFLDKVLMDVKEKCDVEFDTFTRMMDWELMGFGSSKQIGEYDLLNPTKEDTLKRLQSLTDDSCSDKMLVLAGDRSRELTEERCKKIKEASARMFGGVRLLFVKYVRAKYLSFFLQPIFENLDDHCRAYFKKLGSDKIIELAEGPNPSLIEKKIEVSKELVKNLAIHKEAFTQLHKKFKTLPTSTNGKQTN